MHGFDRIFLIGVMGAGKTSVGKELSKLLDFSFIDADVLLEQKLQLSIAEIIQLNGEISFRQEECKLLQEITRHSATVVATGGGCVLNPINRQILKARGLVCHLEVSLDAQLQRLEFTSNRPLLPFKKNQRRSFLINHRLERARLYDLTADIHYNTDKKTSIEVAQDLRFLIKEAVCS